MRREGMPEHMAGDALTDAAFAGRLLDGSVDGTLIGMVARHQFAAWIFGNLSRREHPLPEPIGGGVGEFALQSVGKPNAAETFGQVLLVQFVDALEVFL